MVRSSAYQRERLCRDLFLKLWVPLKVFPLLISGPEENGAAHNGANTGGDATSAGLIPPQRPKLAPPTVAPPSIPPFRSPPQRQALLPKPPIHQDRFSDSDVSHLVSRIQDAGQQLDNGESRGTVGRTQSFQFRKPPQRVVPAPRDGIQAT